MYWSNQATPPCHPGGYCSGPPSIGRTNLDATGVVQKFIKLDSLVGSIAVDGEHIYWSSGNDAIARARLDGRGVDPEFITAPLVDEGSHVEGIAVDARYLYWSHASGIGRASLDGASFERAFIITSRSPAGLAVDVGHLYIAEGELRVL